MVELIFGHDFFGAVWYPAYESFLQVDSFAAALAEALVRVRCGPADRPPAAPPLQALLNGLLELVPERRSTIAELCEAPYFELMRGGPEDSSLLSLTFDTWAGDAKPAKRRPRSAGRTLRASFAVAARAPAPADAGQFPPRKVTQPREHPAATRGAVEATPAGHRAASLPPDERHSPLAEGVPPRDWARTSFAVAP